MQRISPQKVDGVVLLDKPEGISSQTAVTIVKRSCSAQKAGHTGTLDPLATGLLPVCLGEATKYSSDLLNADKTYLATILFGAKTTTGDSEGELISRGIPSFDVGDSELVRTNLELLLPKFSGTIQQVPPMYSALKRDGKPLYEYAREGKVVELEARKVEIHHIAWVSIAWPVATLEVTCSKGTYIRSLASDMGDYLGCGAHLTALRRTKVGHLQIKDANTLPDVKDGKARLMSVDALVSTLPSIVLSEELSNRLCLGQRIPQFDSGSATGFMRVYRKVEGPQSFLGTVEVKNGVLHPRRLIANSDQPSSVS